MKDLTDRAIRAGMDGIRSGVISSYEHGRHTPTKQRYIDLLALCGGKLSDEVATAYGVLESDPAYKRQLHRPATRRVGAELFVRTWQTSQSIDEVMAKLKLTRMQANARAETIRRHGVPLKRFPRHKPGPDWSALKRLAEDLVPHTRKKS